MGFKTIDGCCNLRHTDSLSSIARESLALKTLL